MVRSEYAASRREQNKPTLDNGMAVRKQEMRELWGFVNHLKLKVLFLPPHTHIRKRIVSPSKTNRSGACPGKDRVKVKQRGGEPFTSFSPGD